LTLTADPKASRKAAPRPLEGVVVLDLCRYLSGPYATLALADLGARVIKIEQPGGDDNRRLPPYFVGDTSAHFLTFHRNKESVVVDSRSAEGKALLLELAGTVDMVFENFRPGVMDRLGLGFEALKKVNPRIVLCSISGFGQDGPYRDLPAYDLIIQALSGGMSITGEPGRPPVRAGLPIGDLCGGMFGVIGALAALRQAETTGEAQHVDISMLDVQVSMLSYQAVSYLVSGEIPQPQGRGHISSPVIGSYLCSDGVEIVTSPLAEAMWVKVCEAVERTDLPLDPRFKTPKLRLENKDPLRVELQTAFLKLPSDELLRRLAEGGVPSAPINTVDRVMTDPQVHHRGMLVDMDVRGDHITVLGSPLKLSGVENEYVPAPVLGQHTAAVLRDRLHLSDERIRELASSGVIELSADASPNGTSKDHGARG
jgi:crotonobetainyl-CoA:carnitine CoA-transferase CaiB-like acyl-CoA transferase